MQTPLLLPASEENPELPWLRTKFLAHLLCQERFLNLEDLIQPQNSKLTYIKAHPCSTLDALLYGVASYSSCEREKSTKVGRSFSRKAVSEQKDYMRSQGNPETAGKLLCISFWRQMFILVECLLCNETNPVSTTKPLKNSPAAQCFFPFISVFSLFFGQ